MSLPDPIELQRLSFRQGQQLESRDLRDQVAIEAQRRWWHNRSLHNAYGIAVGFAVEQQGRSVVVHPGLAYDCRGRELILQQPRVIKAPGVLLSSTPAKMQAMVLLARYRETSSYPSRAALSGMCGAGASMFLESPEFFWKPAREVAVTDGVALARISNEGGKQLLDEEFVAARSRAMARPRIVTGATIPGSTAWELWNADDVKERPLGFQVRIDTRAAGFTRTPCYFAWLEGALWNPTDRRFLAAPLGHLAEPSIRGFTFRLWLPPVRIGDDVQLKSNQAFDSRFLSFAQRQNLYVSWVGILAAPNYFSALKDKGATHEHS